MSASASLSVDVAAVVVTEIEVIAREVTADVMLAARARRVHHLESLLLNSVVESDVVEELLLLLSLAFCSACSCIRQKYLTCS